MNGDQQPVQRMLPTDYVQLATDLVRQAQRRIYVVSLSLTRGDATNELIDAILVAAKRGVDVHIAADLFTFICDSNSRLASRLIGRGMRRTDQLRNEFQRAGASFHWLGLQRVPYLIGRTHSKWTVIDDDVFTFGGVNLNQAGVAERADYMFHLTDASVADRLVNEQLLIERIDPEKRRICDREIQTDYGTMLLDSGRFNHSIIYNHAISLAKLATDIILVSQYCPSGKLGQILHAKQARVYFNPKGTAADAANNILIGSERTVSEQHNNYTRSRYLHAKFIIATLPDGSRRAITGSHNFNTIGLHTGTREIALETTRGDIIDQLMDFYRRYVA